MSPVEVIDDLKRYQPYYMDLVTGSNRAGHSQVMSDALKRLHDAGAPGSVAPFVMQLSDAVARGELKESEGVRIVDSLDAFLTRRALCGYEPTGLHAVFKGLWREIAEDPSVSAFEAAISLRKTVTRPSDDEVAEKVRTRELYGASITPYFIREYDASRGGDRHDTVNHIEHVLPQRPASGTWNSFSASQREEFTHRLANLLPLSVQMNQSVSNSEYAVKRARFSEDSVFKSVREFAQKYDEWTPDLLLARGEELASWAVARWPMSSL